MIFQIGPADHADLGKDAPQSALVCNRPTVKARRARSRRAPTTA
jgi:hypothetical protein